MKNAPKAVALLCTAAFVCAGGAISSAIAGSTVPGWPAYVAQGGFGGPNVPAANNISSLSCSDTPGAGNDDFQGAPVDTIFGYASPNGAGDAGIMVGPSYALIMTGDLTTLSNCANNKHGSRVALVEYTNQLSGGSEASGLDDLSNTPNPSVNYPYGNYIMSRHLISIAADAMALNGPQVPACSGALQGPTCTGYAVGGPVVYNGSNYYGTLIVNPDLLGTMEQHSPPDTNAQNWITDASNTLANGTTVPGGVNKAVDIALCFLTNSRTFTNTFNPNGQTVGTVAYDATYTGNPVTIMEQLLADGYPPYSLNHSPSDQYWPYSVDNIVSPTVTSPPTGTPSQVGQWFNACASNPTYNTTTYQRPSFPNTFDGWIQAHNWLLRSVAPKGQVTFGWHENLYAAGGNGDFWLQKQLSSSQVASTFSTPVSSWLQANAPNAVSSTIGVNYTPDYFVFDRYGEDDSNAGAYTSGATLYNAQSWDNYLTGVGQISKTFNNIPVMMWQIPGSHISNTTEANPEMAAGSYVFSTAPVYFFGDSNLTSNLSNIVKGTANTTTPGTAVGNFDMAGAGVCGASFYVCASNTSPYYYSQWLVYYNGVANNYDWSKNNGKLAKAAANNVFAILWGAGNAASGPVPNQATTPDNDHGWLANKIIHYYQSPTPLGHILADTHDFNADGKSDILWRDTGGDAAVWEMSGGTVLSGVSLGNVPTNWSVVGVRDFNGDGVSDLLWRDTAGDVWVWLMNSGAAVSQSSVLGNEPTTWSVAGTGDFDADGKGDILWRDTSGNLKIWFMNGFAISEVAVTNVPTIWSVAGVGDFNGDGKSDILWHDTQGDVSIWTMNGATIMAGSGLGNIPTNWSIVGTGDFNGDGTSDILWRDTAGDVLIQLISNDTLLQQSVLGNVATTWRVTETGDFDGDGKSDILWLDSSGNVMVWFMNGLATSVVNFGNVGTIWAVQGSNAD